MSSGNLPLRKTLDEWLWSTYGSSVVIDKLETCGVHNQDKLLMMCSCGETFKTNAVKLNKCRREGASLACKYCRYPNAIDWVGMSKNGCTCVEIKRDRYPSGKSRKRCVIKCDKCGVQKEVDSGTFSDGDAACTEPDCNPRSGPGNCRMIKDKVWSRGPYFGKMKSQAKRRGIEFHLTREYIYEELDYGVCALSGQPASLEIGNASLDRINSELGYIPGNVQWVTKAVNIMKGPMSNQDFIDVCMEIGKHRGGLVPPLAPDSLG